MTLTLLAGLLGLESDPVPARRIFPDMLLQLGYRRGVQLEGDSDSGHERKGKVPQVVKAVIEVVVTKVVQEGIDGERCSRESVLNVKEPRPSIPDDRDIDQDG